jgi:hypothetical protein
MLYLPPRAFSELPQKNLMSKVSFRCSAVDAKLQSKHERDAMRISLPPRLVIGCCVTSGWLESVLPCPAAG